MAACDARNSSARTERRTGRRGRSSTRGPPRRRRPCPAAGLCRSAPPADAPEPDAGELEELRAELRTFARDPELLKQRPFRVAELLRRVKQMGKAAAPLSRELLALTGKLRGLERVDAADLFVRIATDRRRDVVPVLARIVRE